MNHSEILLFEKCVSLRGMAEKESEEIGKYIKKRKDQELKTKPKRRKTGRKKT